MKFIWFWIVGFVVQGIAPSSINADQMSSSALPLIIECEGLTPEEHQFTSGLSNPLRMMFCKYFNADQRQAALQLDKNSYTPDEAVQEIARQNNFVPPPAQPSERGCPVK